MGLGLEAQNEAAEIKMLAERRAAEILAQMKPTATRWVGLTGRGGVCENRVTMSGQPRGGGR